jgi:1,4-dihydroxy-6-naphthoate synthase
VGEKGLLIHEGQLTHETLGLKSQVNLGQWWWQKTGGLPLPLGVNTVRKDLGTDLMQKCSRIMKRSIKYALDNRQEALDYAMIYARDLEKRLADQFVGMYVNHWTLDMGSKGKQSIELFLKEAEERGFIPRQAPVEFVD